MSLSVPDRKILWAKAGNTCSYHYGGDICDEELIISGDGKDTLVGEECHIVGEKPGAARYIENFPERNSSRSNRILMCRKHHGLIDDNENIYTIEVLKTMKKEHEESIAERIKNEEIKSIIIKDSVFRTEVKNADEAIGMEVNKPAQLLNVKSELVAENVKKATGFSTNQGLTGMITTCSYCTKPIPLSFTGTPPSLVVCTCPHCGKENRINMR